ncbi:MAG: insulinase family protein [Alphaproteobacteria bacterium]|nr:insulinase family protein [Alphaproteobacteria bacterium]
MKYKPSLYKLSNGVSVILDPMDVETAIVSVCFKTGSRDESPEEQGITHFCEHMLGKGTAKFPTKKSIDEYMEMRGGIRNAATGHASIGFGGKILAKNLNALIELIGEQLQNSLFVPEKIEIERKVILNELRQMMDDPDEQLGYFISKTLFNGQTQCYTTLGTLDNIMSFSRQQMIDFLHRRLSANNCIICISGKIIDVDSTLKCLESTFSFLEPKDVPNNTQILYTPSVAHNLKAGKKEIKLRLIIPDIWEQKYENLYAQKCVEKFETFLTKRLFRTLRYEDGLVYELYGTNLGNEKFNWNILSTETNKNNIEQLVAAIAKRCYKFYNENIITDKDLYRLRCGAQLFNADWLESAASRCRTLVSFYYNFNKIYSYEESINMDNAITVDDVVKYSRGYFDGELSVITQGSELDTDLKAVWLENFHS